MTRNEIGMGKIMQPLSWGGAAKASPIWYYRDNRKEETIKRIQKKQLQLYKNSSQLESYFLTLKVYV